jgi:hypothetical protein
MFFFYLKELIDWTIFTYSSEKKNVSNCQEHQNVLTLVSSALDELKYQMHKEWEILRFYNLFLQFKFILYFSCHIKNIFLTTLITFKVARHHLFNGVTHVCDKCVVWPLPHLLSSPPYFVSLLITKMKNCTFIWFLYLIYFLYF